jgi:hypothetical protein
MTHPWRSLRSLVVLAVAVVAMLAFTGQAFAADASPGDATITVPVGDDIAGGTTNITFERVYSDTTASGTPVYVYAPVGWNVNAGKGVLGLDPQVDPNPSDDLKPCADRAQSDYVITQPQITQLGDALKNQIVRVDEAQFGAIGLADESDPDSDALVVLAYNAFDDYFYFCDETSYTAGYFAPNFIDDLGMNVIVVDVLDWANSIGEAGGFSIEGIIAHELEHLLMEYSDTTELSWVDEGLADLAAFFNNYYGDENSALASHSAYHQVYHRETSLTRWGGGLENYGAAYSWFVYLWEQAGGNGGSGEAALKPDGDYDATAGDLLIKLIFQNQADSWEGIESAIAAWEAQTGGDLPDLKTLYQDWVVATYVDKTGTRFGFTNLEFGTEGTSWGYTVDLANNFIWGGRGIYKGAMPEPKWRKGNVPSQVALPYGASYETFTNAGSSIQVDFTGQPGVDVKPLAGTAHWYAGYQNSSDRELNVPLAGTLAAATPLTFDTWWFIENGWDYGFVEVSNDNGATWTTIPLTSAGQTVTTNDDPQGNNTEGNGLTGVSGGNYAQGDQPTYISVTGTLPAGTTNVRFRYSTDAGYLDTGWFVSNVQVGTTAVTPVSPEGDWTLIDGPEQDNNWAVQVIAPCDLTPGTTGANEIVVDGLYVYRYTTDSALSVTGLDTRCARVGGKSRPIVVAISNLPTGALTYFDAPYTFRVSNTGSGAKSG